MTNHDGPKRSDGVPTVAPLARDVQHRAKDENLSLLDRLLQRIGDLLFRIALEPSPHFEYLSASCQPLLGYAPEELLGQASSFDRVVHENDRAHLLSGLRSDVTPSNIVRFIHRDGHFLWLDVRLAEPENTPSCGLLEGIARDITRELEHEQALEDSVELLRSIIDHAPVIVWSLDRHGRFELSEGKGLEQLGITPGQIVGQSVWELYAAYPTILNATRRALHGETVDGNFDLGAVTFDFHYAPHFDRHGQPAGATGVAVDVTRRYRAEHTNQQLLTAIEQAAEAFVLTDRGGRVSYVNPAYEKTSGYRKAQVTAKPWATLEIAADVEFLVNLELALSKGVAWSGRIRSRRANGTYFDETVTLSPIVDLSGNLLGAVAVKRDITEQLRWEEQLRQSQKMEAVGQLAGGIAHDFNNLLQVIRGNLELLVNQPIEDHLQHPINDISHATDRATKLVAQLLAFSRKDPVEFTILRLDRLVFALLGVLRRLLGDDIEVEWFTTSGVPHIRANAAQIEQVVINLCINARDAMPRGGKLRLEVTTKALGTTTGKTTTPSPSQPLDQYAVLTINDNGEGMTSEIRDRIFEPFFTTKDIGRGTGLGLATVYAILERHGGFIEVTSEPGQGTTFCLYFPAVEGQESASGTFKASPSLQGNNRLVLVAEDDPQIRNLTAKFLTRAGFRVVTATNGAEAEALILQNAGELSLVILDAIMPHLRGPEVYLRMRSRGNMTPCLIVTGYDFRSLDPILELSQALVLQKPFDIRQLFDRIGLLLGET